MKCFISICFVFGFFQLINGQIVGQDSIAPTIQNLVDEAWDYTLSSNDSSLLRSNKALEISIKNKYILGQVLAKESLGLYHEIVEGDIEKASNYYFEGIEICEKNNLDYIASMNHTLGVMFHMTDNYDNAKAYYLKSLQKAEKQNDSILIKKCLINLGSVHSSLEDFETSEYYMKRSLTFPQRKEMDFTTLANLGYLYVKQQKFNDAIPVLLKATEQHPDNPDAEINLYFLLHAKVMAKDSSGMKKPLQRAMLAAKDSTIGLRDQSLLLRNIADYLAFTGDYKQALSYRDTYVHVFEEIKEKQRDQIVLDTEAKYETEKKDAQLKVLTLENEKATQQRQLYFFIALAGVSIAGLVGYFLYKNRKKNTLLAKQKSMLEKTVDEKNILLRETHHRVKNSFQMVSSLLQYQSFTAKDKEAKIAIKEAQNRVRSMVLIHQKLYSKDQLVGIDSKEYIEDFTEDVIRSHEYMDHKLNYELHLESHILDIETITPIGLILNELLTNILKHAFPEVTKTSMVHISFRKNKERLELIVSDNGVGITEKVKDNSFGLKLIETLAKKLKGTLSINENIPTGMTAKLEIYRFSILK